MSAKYEAYIESEADGLDISVLAVVPDETPYRGILQLVHGMSEYKERYLPFMEYMAKRGYVCVIHDHRGHGKSVRAMDDLGYMYGGGADAILKDIEVVNREMHQQLPDLPLILFGHSMVAGPRGQILEELTQEAGGEIVQTLDLDEIARCRATMPSLKDRHPEDYGVFCAPRKDQY